MSGAPSMPDIAVAPEAAVSGEIRGAKIGLMNLFIDLTKKGQMEPEEVTDYIGRVKTNGFISEDDAKILTHQLDVTLGRTPEQIRESKMGLVDLFIGLAKKGEMEPEEVTDRIEQLAQNGFIKKDDVQELSHKLDVTLGRTPEQIRESKLGLLNLFIGLSKEGKMGKEEVVKWINKVKSNGFITGEDTQELMGKLS